INEVLGGRNRQHLLHPCCRSAALVQEFFLGFRFKMVKFCDRHTLLRAPSGEGAIWLRMFLWSPGKSLPTYSLSYLISPHSSTKYCRFPNRSWELAIGPLSSQRLPFRSVGPSSGTSEFRPRTVLPTFADCCRARLS